MRGELLSILSVTWWKNKVIIGKGHKFIPVCVVAQWTDYLKSEEQDVEYDFPSDPSGIHSHRQIFEPLRPITMGPDFFYDMASLFL